MIVFITNRNRGAGTGEGSTTALVSILIGLVVYNIVLAVLLLAGLKSRVYQAFIIIVDALIAPVVYWASGGLNLLMLGAGLLPTVIATLRFGRGFGFAVALLIGVTSLGITAITGVTGAEAGGLPISIGLLILTPRRAALHIGFRSRWALLST